MSRFRLAVLWLALGADPKPETLRALTLRAFSDAGSLWLLARSGARWLSPGSAIPAPAVIAIIILGALISAHLVPPTTARW